MILLFKKRVGYSIKKHVLCFKEIYTLLLNLHDKKASMNIYDVACGCPSSVAWTRAGRFGWR